MKKRRYVELSEVEDRKDFHKILDEIGERAALNAINENKALGLPITYLEDGWVVSKWPDGTIERISQVETSPLANKIKLKKGTVLHVRKAR